MKRQARERREYVYAKSLEAQERQTYERKRQLRDALASGKELPTERRKDAEGLQRDLVFDEAQARTHSILDMAFFVPNNLQIKVPVSHIDNEYQYAGMRDPKILVTTSRDPSSKLLQFAKVCLCSCVLIHLQRRFIHFRR